MTVGKIKRQLVREIRAKPSKAVALGLSLVVAAYFWTPLLMGRDREHDTDQIPAGAMATTAVAQLPQEIVTSQQATPEIPWRQLDGLMNADPRMTATSHIALARDPFTSSRFAKEQDEAQTSGAELDSRALSPADLGLKLTSTVIGNRRATALISGRTYQIGQHVEKTSDGTKRAFTLAEIHPRRVVLQRGDQEYELRLNQTSMNGVVMLQTSDDSD